LISCLPHRLVPFGKHKFSSNGPAPLFLYSSVQPYFETLMMCLA
jgi:hypothetical protein